jgi:hypothetical protein
MSEDMAQPIYTLNARGNIMLEVMQEHFGLDSRQMFVEISQSFDEFLKILVLKKIDYASLKSALIPNPDRIEAAFVFDTLLIASNWYGREVFDNIIPALDPSTTLSVLCGDLSGENSIQDRLYEEFIEAVNLVRDSEWKHSSQYFVVYINNLSESMLLSLCKTLNHYSGYIG